MKILVLAAIAALALSQQHHAEKQPCRPGSWNQHGECICDYYGKHCTWQKIDNCKPGEQSMGGAKTCVCNTENCWWSDAFEFSDEDVDMFRRQLAEPSPKRVWRFLGDCGDDESGMDEYGFCDCDGNGRCAFIFWSEFDDPASFRRNLDDCDTPEGMEEYGFCKCNWQGVCSFVYWPDFEDPTHYRRNMKDLSRKVHLHGRKVDCYQDLSYEDEWGYCDCWDNIDRNTVCGYWEYCEHDDPTICYQRPKSTLPKRRVLANSGPNCIKLGPTYEDRLGFCECGAVNDGTDNSCWWNTFQELN